MGGGGEGGEGRNEDLVGGFFQAGEEQIFILWGVGGRLPPHSPIPPGGETPLCDTNMDDSIDSGNFSVRGDLPLIE